jgi:hypothetical protein
MSSTTLTPRRAHTQSLLRRHPLISFFVLTSWSASIIVANAHRSRQ